MQRNEFETLVIDLVRKATELAFEKWTQYEQEQEQEQVLVVELDGTV